MPSSCDKTAATRASMLISLAAAGLTVTSSVVLEGSFLFWSQLKGSWLFLEHLNLLKMFKTGAFQDSCWRCQTLILAIQLPYQLRSFLKKMLVRCLICHFLFCCVVFNLYCEIWLPTSSHFLTSLFFFLLLRSLTLISFTCVLLFLISTILSLNKFYPVFYSFGLFYSTDSWLQCLPAFLAGKLLKF